MKLKSRPLPGGGVRHFARYTDPATGKERDLSLDGLGLTNQEGRVSWAKQLSRELSRQRADIASGAMPSQETPLADAIGRWLEAHERDWRPATVIRYRKAIAIFTDWADAAGVHAIESLTPQHLDALRLHVATKQRHVVSQGGKRGERRTAGGRRASATINSDLNAIKSMLNHWRRLGMLPRLSSDAVRDVLKRVPTDRSSPTFHSAQECRAILDAALRHDADVFKLTRADLANGRLPSATRRYAPIAPFVAMVLLSGCRKSEAAGLLISEVELDAPDSSGERVGQIVLRAERVKTRWARTIGLEVAPALRHMLLRLILAAPPGAQRVFMGTAAETPDLLETSRKRLIARFGAPKFTWQSLRATTSTFLTNAPGIYGAAAHFMSARQLGHSVAVAEKHYAGLLRGIPPTHRTLTDAIGVCEGMQEIINGIQGRRPLRAGGE